MTKTKFSTGELASFNTIFLENIRIGIQKRFPAIEITSFQIQEVNERLRHSINDYFVIQLDAFISGKRDTITKDVDTRLFPETWWDHFKFDHFPGWLRKKYPPKMQRVTVRLEQNITKFCPHIPPPRSPINMHYLWLDDRGEGEGRVKE